MAYALDLKDKSICLVHEKGMFFLRSHDHLSEEDKDLHLGPYVAMRLSDALLMAEFCSSCDKLFNKPIDPCDADDDDYFLIDYRFDEDRKDNDGKIYMRRYQLERLVLMSLIIRGMVPGTDYQATPEDFHNVLAKYTYVYPDSED